MKDSTTSTAARIAAPHGIAAEKELAAWLEGNFAGNDFSLRKGRVCIVSCGVSTYTWLVKSGNLFGTMRDERGDKELAYSFFHAGQILYSMQSDISVELHALNDAVLVQYPTEPIHAATRKDAHLCRLFAEHFHARFQTTLNRYRQAALISSEERLYQLESELSTIEKIDPDAVDDSTLGLFLGMHRVSVNKIRKKLRIAPPPPPSQN